jgi:hypothetical protein
MKANMKTTLLVATVTLAASGFALAASPASVEEHAVHHPPAAAAKEDAAKVDQQMNMMRDMHAKMLAAKTPEERAALMDDHMKAMQNGMAMMGSMNGKGMRGGKGMGGKHDMMARRMDMMEIMMQMMMDREGMKPPATK